MKEEQKSSIEAWSRLKAAVEKRLRDSGATALLLGGAILAPGAVGASPATAPPSEPRPVVERVLELRGGANPAAPGATSVPNAGPGASYNWGDHWRDHWPNHWDNHH